MNFPFEWQPTIVSHQLAMLGDVALACVPGEFTTMAGRRLRAAVHDVLRDSGGPTPQRPEDVIIVGLCNTYSDYITTPEEYEVSGLLLGLISHSVKRNKLTFINICPGPTLRGGVHHIRSTHAHSASQDVPGPRQARSEGKPLSDEHWRLEVATVK